ncbi:MAG TPA: Type 1 glutamine amidotransferase-like domain-containing protein [Candidatus Saccharimonadales bacterium]|nr:Type 1 glutamine amidotransferase-like domain-containing protein [Candidatus Saccharimonadales bacterium]
MKKLFLASFAYKTLDKIKPLLTDKPQNLTVAFIPTAADPYENKNFVNIDRDKLVELGFRVIDIDIKNKTEKDLWELLKNVDLIAVAGGNTYYLLYHAQKSGFIALAKKLINQGVIYVGSSAGSILACSTIDTARLFDPSSIVPELQSYEGMGLVDFLIIPHFDKQRYVERLQKTIEEWSKKKYHLFPLTDQQAIVVQEDNYSMVEVK